VLNNAVINYCQSTIGDFNESQLFYDKFNNNGKSFIQWEFTSQHILTLNLTLLLQNGVVNLTEKRARLLKRGRFYNWSYQSLWGCI